MNSQKLDYNLPETAKIWTQKFNKKISVDDIIKFAIESERSFYLPPMSVRDIHLTPALCISAWIDAPIQSIYDARTSQYLSQRHFTGRLFVPAGLLLSIVDDGYAYIKSSSSMDENKWIVLTEKVKITKEDLVITHTEKLKFECEYVLNHSKIGGGK